MRVTTPGVERAGEPFSFSFDGQAVEAWPGESLAAALTSAGVFSMREARDGSRRGLFCGMGVCGECSVIVDGVQRRSCLEPAQPGLKVATMPPRAPVDLAAEAPSAPADELTPDVLVIGAGPGGLAAARAAASAGLDVLLVDERVKAGGQYFKQPGEGMRLGDALDAQFVEGRELIESAKAAGAKLLPGATVWGAFGPDDVAVVADGRRLRIRAKRVILSPGAYERAHPVPGWTLPGVMTTGAAQTLLRAYQTSPGQRVLIAGNGPLNLQVARELTRAGVAVVAVAEQAAMPGPGDALDLARMAVNAPGLVVDGVGHVAALALAGVSIRYRHVLTRVEGEGKAQRAAIARVGDDGRIVAGSERWFDIDAVCLGYGFLPQSEIGRALGCAYDVTPAGLVAQRDDEARSSVPEVFIVGDAGGLGGARVALALGTLAGTAAARDLGKTPADTGAVKRLLARHRSFQAALWRVYRPVELTQDLTAPDTLLCRCESVDRATVDSLLDDGLGTLSSVKKACRIGMGRCQGRYCGPVVAARIAGRTGKPIEADAWFAPRTPFKPIDARLLAGDDPA
ncbi:FAD-dependent oxidoreductase [Sphingoaurantiacus capsulatus]|uniref:FAD-dependent oxidoreductase n=1 Tax=Sphingoaurantiacus capsulatus TaxID=1771310 RepID=A0ABV7XDV0_9SPHN